MSREQAARIAMKRRMDEEILIYVRESQNLAPVPAEAVHGYLKRVRQFDVDRNDVELRLDYLKDKGRLKSEKVFNAGDYDEFWEITADGMDVLDGVIPA